MRTSSTSSSSLSLPRHGAARVVRRYTVLGIATGAIPVPAVSLALVAENASMINEIAGCYGVPISPATVVGSMGMMTAVNQVGRAVFVEAARAMGWFTGPLGVPGIVVLGAATAGLQTYILGHLAIAIAENGGEVLEKFQARSVIAAAKVSYDDIDWDVERERAEAATA